LAVFFYCKWVSAGVRAQGAFLHTFFALEKSMSGFGSEAPKTVLRFVIIACLIANYQQNTKKTALPISLTVQQSLK